MDAWQLKLSFRLCSAPVAGSCQHSMLAVLLHSFDKVNAMKNTVTR